MEKEVWFSYIKLPLISPNTLGCLLLLSLENTPPDAWTRQQFYVPQCQIQSSTLTGSTPSFQEVRYPSYVQIH